MERVLSELALWLQDRLLIAYIVNVDSLVAHVRTIAGDMPAKTVIDVAKARKWIHGPCQSCGANLNGDVEFSQPHYRILPAVADARIATAPAAAAGNGAKQKRQRRKPGDLNGAMLSCMMQNHESRGWTSKKWATELHAHESQIVKQPAWTELEHFRSLQRIQRRKDRHRRGVTK